MTDIVSQSFVHCELPSTPGIYAIVNLVNQHKYVGSAVNLLQRKRDHLKSLRAGTHRNAHLQYAYDHYGSDAFRFEILEHVEHVEYLLAREQFYIDTLNPHYNIARTAGSSLGVKRTPEHIAKMSASKLGKKHTPESRENMGAPKRGKKQSPEHIAKRSAARLGKKASPEHIAKNRAANLGKKMSAEARAKMSATRLGRKQSPEHIANRSAALMGRRASPEHVAKATEAARLVNTGKKRPPEVRAKISATKRAKKLSEKKAIQPPLF